MLSRSGLRATSFSQLHKNIAAPFVPRRHYDTTLKLFNNTALGHLDNELVLEPRNPATGTVSRAPIQMDSLDSIRKKFMRAKGFQRDWAKTSFEERKRVIRRFGELLQLEKPKLALALTTEMGKPISQSIAEITAVESRINFFLEHTERFLQEEVMRVVENGKMTEKVTYEPLGAVLNISAWNYPYFVGCNVWIPALLTGNTVVYKPSELVTVTGQHIDRLIHLAGVPDDAFITVVGKINEGELLTGLPFDGIFFTGSHKAGKRIAKRVAGQMSKVQLELGGKDAVYVTEQADIANAAQSLAEGVFYNTGQSCCAVERIYVHRNVFPQFEDAFVAAVNGFKFGKDFDPRDPDAFLGPLAREQQLPFLQHLVHHAQRRGAKLLTGGKPVDPSKTKGWYFEPTVLSGVNHTMELMHFETFGPVIGLQSVNNDEDAISLMNDTEYGLTAGVFGSDEQRAIDILSQVDVGTCYWNACDRVSPFLPWTGRKHSGIGSTLGHEGIRAFLRPRSWHLRKPKHDIQGY